MGTRDAVGGLGIVTVSRPVREVDCVNVIVCESVRTLATETVVCSVKVGKVGSRLCVRGRVRVAIKLHFAPLNPGLHLQMHEGK